MNTRNLRAATPPSSGNKSGFLFSPRTRAHFAPSENHLNISMDFNAAPNGQARGTEVIIPDNASPELRAAAERYNQGVAAFAAQHGIENYPIRGVRTRSENGRGVPHTVHTEPFFNTDTAMQEAIKANPAAFAGIYRDAFGSLPNARAIAPHGVKNDRGAASPIFGDETSFGELIARAGSGSATIKSESGQESLLGGLSMTPQAPPDNLRNEAGTMNLKKQSTDTRFNDDGKELASGLMGRMFPNMTADRQDRLAIALGGMSMNPNYHLMNAARDRLVERRETRRGRQQGNRTAEWLSTQPGGSELAQAIMSGAMPASDALRMWHSNQKGTGPTRGVAINGQLVNPVNGAVIGDYRTPGGEGGTEYGLTPQYATNADGDLTMIQLSKDGTAKEVTLPDGLALQRGLEKVDLGTGYQWFNTLTGEPVGNPIQKDNRGAARETAAGSVEGRTQAEAVSGAPAAAAQAQNGIELIDSIINDPALPSITGMVQGRLPPMTQAGTDLNIRIEQLQGKAFLEAFESLKGGGTITEREGLAAQNAMARLQRAQSEDEYRRALGELRQIMLSGLTRAQGHMGQPSNVGGEAIDSVIDRWAQ